MEPPQEVITKLLEDSLFKDWIAKDSNAFLSHFFCPLTANLETKTNWEVGYFDPESGKITVFVLLDNGTFRIKPADDVFKKETSKVEKLNLEKVSLSFEQAAAILKENVGTYFPSEVLGDGFLILQSLQQKVLWNFTFLSKTLKFVNIKINAEDGNIEDHQTVNLMQK